MLSGVRSLMENQQPLNLSLVADPYHTEKTEMQLETLIFELMKTGFTIESTINADLTVTILTRNSDNARAKILSTASNNTYCLALFPIRDLDLSIVIKRKPFPFHHQIDGVLSDFADRINSARSTNKHFFYESENCTCSDNPGCRMICDGGLALCALCGHLEGSLTTDCPATHTHSQYGDLVYAGTIDYRDGAWVDGVSSPYSPAHYKDIKRTHVGCQSI